MGFPVVNQDRLSLYLKRSGKPLGIFNPLPLSKSPWEGGAVYTRSCRESLRAGEKCCYLETSKNNFSRLLILLPELPNTMKNGLFFSRKSSVSDLCLCNTKKTQKTKTNKQKTPRIRISLFSAGKIVTTNQHVGTSN